MGKMAGYCNQEDWRKFEMKMSVWVLSALLLGALCLLESDSHGQDNFARVARIFGRGIYVSDLNPTNDELKMLKRLPREVSDEQIISEVRSEKLAHLIWTPIIDKFDRTHDVEPTKAEREDYTRSMNAFMKEANIPSRPEEPKLSASMEREVAKIEDEIHRDFVRNWKRSKALYEEYGGIVIFQQFNPMEPLGALRKLLENHEAKGDFEIYDEELKRQFWKYYLQDHRALRDVDYSKPWWKKR
jgi:hypothetical protein